jgi:hypothetical protein
MGSGFDWSDLLGSGVPPQPSVPNSTANPPGAGQPPAVASDWRDRAEPDTGWGREHAAAILGSSALEPRKNWVIEPTLMDQSGDWLPEGASIDDSGHLYGPNGEPMRVLRRPNVLPFVHTPDGGREWVMPKLLELLSFVASPVAAGRVPLRAGEAVLGSGPVRGGGSALPMDQASRLARARAMGFRTQMPLAISLAPEGEKIASAAINVNGKIFPGLRISTP